MRSVRRLPPLLRALWLLDMLAILASLGVNTWAYLLGRENGEPRQQLYLAAWALLEFGLACGWTVTTYNARLAPVRRPRRAMPWLDAWRGQLMSAFVLSVLPIATMVAALLVSTTSPLFVLAYAGSALSVVVLFAAYALVLMPGSRRGEEPGA